MARLTAVALPALPLLLAACVSAPVTKVIVIETTGAGRNVTRVTQTSEDEVDPSVSPDGAQVAFVILKNGLGDIYSMNTKSGTGRIQITNHEANDVHPAWIDAKTVIFSSNRLGAHSLWKQLASGGGGCTMVTRGNDMVDYAPTVAPTGAQACFHSVGAGGSEKVIQRVGADEYVVYRNNLPYIWKVGMNGTDLTQFGKGAFPQWSPDGLRIAYCSDVGGNWDICTMKIDGTEETLVTSGSAGDQIQPSFSPDGKWIAYVSNQAKNYDLWIMAADGSKQTQLTSDKSDEFSPSWGADGNIYFSSKKSGSWDIWSLTPVLPE